MKDTAVWCGGCGCLHQRPTGRGQQTSHSGPRTPSGISRAVITTNGKEIQYTLCKFTTGNVNDNILVELNLH